MKGRTTSLLVVCVAAAALLIVLWPGDGSERLEFVAATADQSSVDVDPRGNSLGDMTIRSGPLTDDDGERAGRHDGTCTVTSSPEDDDERRVRCAITLTVGTANGETELQLAAVGRVAADDVVFSVVGGSGKYRDASGEAVFDYTDRDRIRVTVNLDD